MMDNYDLFEREDARLQAQLAKLPCCEICNNPIQQDDAVRIHGDWFCDDCLHWARTAIEWEEE